jgi:hypothetical protein
MSIFRINFNQHFLKILPVFRIQEILARILIIGSVPEKTDTNVYGFLSYLFGGIEMQ